MTVKKNIRNVSLTMVNGATIRGSINIGNSFRLSDFLNKSENTFITLFDAVIEDGKGKGVVFIDRNHIAYVKPVEMGGDAVGNSPADGIEIDLAR